MTIENLKRLASAIGSVEFHTEGFDQIVGNGTFYGGLIMHQDGENIIAQCVLEPWASYLAAANPKAVLEMIAALEARDRALQTIARWDLPAVDGKWPDGSQMSYGAAYGSNGEREYMRQVALTTLKDRAPAAPVVAEGLTLVPVVPTEKMMGILQWFDRGSPAQITEGWARVLAEVAAHPVAGSPAEAVKVECRLKDEFGNYSQWVEWSISDADYFEKRGWNPEDAGNGAIREFRTLYTHPSAAEPMPAFPERDLSKPAEQQGMFRKFDVRRTDGSSAPGGKHYGCRYWVLDLAHDQHAPAAMRAYATDCAATHPQLAADIVAEFGEPMPASEAPARCGSYECRAGKIAGTLCPDGECDIESGIVSATAAPVPASEAASVDTPEFRSLLCAYAVAVHKNKSVAAMDDARTAIFDYIASRPRLAAPAAPTDARAIRMDRETMWTIYGVVKAAGRHELARQVSDAISAEVDAFLASPPVERPAAPTDAKGGA